MIPWSARKKVNGVCLSLFLLRFHVKEGSTRTISPYTARIFPCIDDYNLVADLDYSLEWKAFRDISVDSGIKTR